MGQFGLSKLSMIRYKMCMFQNTWLENFEVVALHFVQVLGCLVFQVHWHIYTVPVPALMFDWLNETFLQV